MQVRHYKTLMQGHPGIARTQAIAWSSNNKRLAVVDANRFVHLYDELGERRDKFPTKASDGKSGKSYVVTGLAFSPDNARVAIAQSDNIVFIYAIGLEWGEKKTICGKYPQTSPVTCVCWPHTSAQGVELIAFGTLEGKVKVGLTKARKSQSLYSHEHAVVSIAANREGNKIVAGHLDGAVYVYIFESEDANEATGSKKLFTHSCTPYVLSWGEHLCAAGQDSTVTFYNSRSGQRMQSFDYPIKSEGDFTVGQFNPSGQALAVCSHDKIRLFDYNLRSRKWEEGKVLAIPNSYAISALSWKQEGSRLVVGTVTGAVDMFDACLKRYRLRGAFEFTYVSHNQVIVKRLATGTRIVLRSNMGYEVQRVNVHKDRYLVAHTSTTLLVGDLVSCKLSEVAWQLTGRERFVFDNPQVCMVFTAGELCLIEYGKNTLLGTCRTEERNAHRISVRVWDPPSIASGASDAASAAGGAGAGGSSGSGGADASESAGATAAAVPAASTSGAESKGKHEEPSRRVIAYLIDRQTIQVDNLITGVPVARIAHHVKIDWLELNFRANRLLFRDKQHQLFLYDIPTQQRTTLLNYCSYVQWVPGSDVVVAQNRMELCVWYSIDAPERVTIVPIKGEVEGIERSTNKTEVIVDEGVNTIAYGLDEALIEFGTAMEDRDYDRACDLLDRIAVVTAETESMWSTLASVAVQEMRLRVAERCFAALGHVAKVDALQRIHQLAAKAAADSNGATDGYDHYTVRAELCVMAKDYKRAEQLYLENGKVEEAMQMWEDMGRFDRAIEIAEGRGLPDLANRRARYFSWLMETKQYEKAGEVKEREGKHIDAINLYLRGGTPARAANVVSTNNLRPEQQLLEAIAAALFKAQVFEKAGDFFERLKMNDRAIEAYSRGHVYSRAVEFAKRVCPDKVVPLEETWGDYLVSCKHVDQAINHYTEAGVYRKAVKAAINSRQWSKATNILDTQTVGAGDNDPTVKGYYKTIARHYEETHQYGEAEKFFIKAGSVNDAVEMYSRAGMADHMYRVAQRHLDQKELVTLFVNQAKQLETKGDFAGAERIYLKVNEPDQAIVMYKKNRDFTNMIRLVQAYRPDYLLKTHLSLGSQFEKENNLKLAETHYVAGKDWGRAVNMYRDRDMWEDAVRVAKVHGGANAAKQVVLSRALTLDADEGVHLLVKFNLVEQGIDAALDAQNYDLALQWAQIAQPAKLPYVFLKYAMHYEDQGDFRMAEDAFVKSGKPREAIDMYVHQHEFSNAMRVAEEHDPSAISSVCVANGRVCFQQAKYKEAEALFVRANAPEALLKMYMDARMFSEAQRVAKEHCPEMLGEIAKRIALQSNDPQKAGAVLEENREYQLALETYMNATSEMVPDPNTLAQVWVRAVKVAQKHVRNMLKEVLRIVTGKLKDAQRYVEAGKCLEDCEDYKGAINMYVQGKKFDMAETLAKRISPELVDYVRRAIVQDSIDSGSMRDAQVVEEMDPEAAMKAYLGKSDFENALRLAKQRTPEQLPYIAALKMQAHLKNKEVMAALETASSHTLDTDDFRFYDAWLELAQSLVPMLSHDDGDGSNANNAPDLTNFHAQLVKVLASMRNSGQKPEEVARANAVTHLIHIYHTARLMRNEFGLPEFSLKLLLGLPRWIPYVAPDKAFFDAGMAAKDAKADDLAFLYLNRALDIVEKIEDGEKDSRSIDNTDFDLAADFPKTYLLPPKPTVPKEKMEEVSNWVLTVSIETASKAQDRTLPTAQDPQTGEDMFEGALKSSAESEDALPECAVTGYPILGGGLTRCPSCQRTANQGDWNRFVMAARQCPWCGAKVSPDFQL